MSTEQWQGKRVTVAGLGISGVPAARVLHRLGAVVTVVNDGADERSRAQAADLEALGITVRLGDGDTLPEGTELVVTTPGWRPDKPLFTAAAEAGVEIWGDVELAWRLRGPDAAPWLAVTGTNGKTTTVRMLAAILEAAGLRTAAVGNIGVSLLDAVLGENTGENAGQDAGRDGGEGADANAYDVLAVELSSYQLHWAPSLRAHSAAVLNLAPDHLDWHGSMEAYAADKGRIYEGNTVACVYNAADPATEDLVREADVEEGCRAIGFTLGTPGPSQLGVVDGILVDRAFVANRHQQAQELAEVADIDPPAPHNIANALAAAALARAFGVPATAVREGLRSFRPDPHRIEKVADVAGVAYVDDSKATNTHAAAASLAAYEPIVWIAGGLAKGAVFDELVGQSADRLRAVVLMGADRALIREALARHAPEVPVVDLDRTDTGAMAAAVREAARLARPGDTVLLAPACASMDMFVNYTKRGEAFADAVRALAAERA
ncbi:UDP-N-acetylmuramoyl-L-alanine--D-glutamate ligase [Streptomyces clavuligerus]|uniref:UDP-N-acetylmuramoylalanine--D-glutamate ligase n=1 Tax=Streptomyces clavuligerus TaxID=1901 RepID=B5GXP5_STRCL|nr:UDP-N-acetylmuramoyl-L-alanine--D-glutamate ligase [Streptomyces clavuligerus]ANW20625.1 UDP-N-acetylmuramoyl-L-alanine--D-glutamate ligase [Streptomyces clavuligerus]AXU15251.1 UDP-N-acetylmuramoyl-L-alanine--D-glutamate ligase [Streptomyces clavuligerus]EDY51091.1 UDP-N-acetylmuramoylalanine-D-glutamate ligase [Streptomyces clavuligerus]EFG06376.1 UDP-N-acetylmuramoylalanine--D-glutamate ligase [Streptomyces clavuligerus]MBY6305326.1 UDP-N-acetylmuramoyl-L-alanine--D-glutamate ligase [Str